MLDARFRDPYRLKWLGALCVTLVVAGLASAALYQLIKGVMTGVVMKAPSKRSLWMDIFVSASEEPLWHTTQLVGWVLVNIILVAATVVLGWLFFAAGGFAGSIEKLTAQRILRARIAVDRGIANELTRLIPGDWASVRLELSWIASRDMLYHVVTNAEGETQDLKLSEALYASTAALQQIFRRNHARFEKVTYSLTRTKDGTFVREIGGHPASIQETVLHPVATNAPLSLP